jgi:peptidoglycan/LPS O-acetylase OafA/YrhL
MALDRQRIENLDAVRFVAAAWVAISHGALPFKSLLSDSDPGLRLIAGALTSTFNGQAAVMVFFIVSGLCIHWPNIGAHSLRVGEFLARRYPILFMKRGLSA